MEPSIYLFVLCVVLGLMLIGIEVFVPGGIRTGREIAIRRMASARQAILAIQRALRGERLPAGRIKAIQYLFPDVSRNLYASSRFTI